MSAADDQVQLGFDGMPRRLYSAAPTRLLAYLDCPRRYRLTYLDRPAPAKGPPWAHNSVGAAVHGALAGWWRLPLEERTPQAGARLVERGWLPDGFRDDRQCAMQRERAAAMVAAYLTDVDPADEPVAVERTVSLTTTCAALWGRADRIDERPGEGLVVVDYKTGRHLLTVDDAQASLAMAVYAAATARTLRRECRRVELHHLPSAQVLAWQHTDESLQRHLRRADSLAAEVARVDEAFYVGMSPEQADELFPARPGPRCGWCDLNRV
ncbi:MAG: PD-(D/E)XK nuclease family protein [Actinomycetota bacterium]|nr:PD-(D/E)XK nuclease family protein [Actinomycetota bacterium]